MKKLFIDIHKKEKRKIYMKALGKLLWSFVIGGIVMTGCSVGAPGQNDASVTEIQKEKETSEIKDVHTHY